MLRFCSYVINMFMGVHVCTCVCLCVCVCVKFCFFHILTYSTKRLSYLAIYVPVLRLYSSLLCLFWLYLPLFPHLLVYLSIDRLPAEIQCQSFDAAATVSQEPGMNRPCFLHLDDQRQRTQYWLKCTTRKSELHSTCRFADVPLAGSSPTKENMPLGTICNRAKCFGDLALQGDSDDLHAASLSYCLVFFLVPLLVVILWLRCLQPGWPWNPWNHHSTECMCWSLVAAWGQQDLWLRHWEQKRCAASQIIIVVKNMLLDPQISLLNCKEIYKPMVWYNGKLWLELLQSI